ncbi:T9SS type A sorting domain-containing protein [Parabacteroides merdae]|uniref:T9SS type A sorting domain-containing protein n=1 Tax=Parabacteroides merdae TaxID=46503 RepID=UPI0022E6416E|nr:T9SS type A sorting domain-containing protein [Parabacteroides merdae]
MKVLITFVLLLAAWAGCPLEVMAQQANTTVAKDKEPDSVEISAYDNKIVVENAPAGSKLEVYSVVGIRVKEIPMKQPSGEYTVDLAKGYYIVRIGDTVRKVSIR